MELNVGSLMVNVIELMDLLYIEGEYWNISSIGLVPIVTISFTDKNKIEEIANVFSKYMTCKIYNTLEPHGKIIYDSEHCERYIRSKFSD